MKIKIKDIIVSDRIRKDLGDIEDLASDIESNGLINPIVVNRDNRLLAGERRLEAVKSLGWEEVPVTVMETIGPAQELSIEISENEARKEFSRAERVSYMNKLHEIEAAKAKGRMVEAHTIGTQNSAELGESMEIVAKEFGISRDTARKEMAIVENKDLLEPDDFADWDEGRLSTNKAYRLLKEQLAKAQEETDVVKRLLQSERVESIKAKKAAEEAQSRAQGLRDLNEMLGAENMRMGQEREKLEEEAAEVKDQLEMAKAVINARNSQPETVVERIVETVPDDYESLKDAVARSEAEQVKLFEEGQEKSRKIRELETQLGREKLLQDADRDAQAFTTITLDYIRRYGGRVWSFEQLSELSEPVRLELVKAVRALNSFTGVLLQNLGGWAIE